MTDEGPREVHVRIERREGRRAEQVVWFGLALLVVAVIKPWGAGAPPGPTRAPARAAVIVPATPQPIEPEQACVRGRWSVETDERGIGSVVRTAVLTDAVEALGPLDARITFVIVAAQRVNALGFCPPFYDPQPGATATFYRLDPVASPVVTTPISIPTGARAMANVLYRPANDIGAAASAAPLAWAAGRYVIRVDAADGYRRWIGLDLRLLAVPVPRPATAVPSTE